MSRKYKYLGQFREENDAGKGVSRSLRSPVFISQLSPASRALELNRIASGSLREPSAIPKMAKDQDPARFARRFFISQLSPASRALELNWIASGSLREPSAIPKMAKDQDPARFARRFFISQLSPASRARFEIKNPAPCAGILLAYLS